MSAPHVERAEHWVCDRLAMEVVGVSGRASEVEFRLRRDILEIWHLDYCCAAFDRDCLRAWLAHPGGVLVVDEVRLTADAVGRVALSLPSVARWTFSPVALAELRQQV